MKLFADDTLLFSVIHDVNVDASSATLNSNLVKIQEWVYNWKMFFNSYRTKPAQEVMFSRQTRKCFYLNLYFNDQSIERSVGHKHLVLTMDEELSFTNCINDKINKTLNRTSLLPKLSTLLPRKSLINIYKLFIRSHLDYGDIIYDHPVNEFHFNKEESVQCKAVLTVTGAIQESSRGKL